MTPRLVRLSAIDPLHAVRDSIKLATLVESMYRRGWVGRPLLVAVYGDGYQAWTGSHRIAAARVAGIERVPVKVISERIMDRIEASHEADYLPGWDPRYSMPRDSEALIESLAERRLLPRELLALYRKG